MIIPPRLKAGDTVGIISPSKPLKNKLEHDLFKNAVAEVENKLGLKVKLGKNIWKEYYYSAGTPEERVNDLHDMLSDNEVRAIIFTIGGKSANQLLKLINWSLFKKESKDYRGDK